MRIAVKSPRVKTHMRTSGESPYVIGVPAIELRDPGGNGPSHMPRTPKKVGLSQVPGKWTETCQMLPLLPFRTRHYTLILPAAKDALSRQLTASLAAEDCAKL